MEEAYNSLDLTKQFINLSNSQTPLADQVDSVREFCYFGRLNFIGSVANCQLSRMAFFLFLFHFESKLTENSVMFSDV